MVGEQQVLGALSESLRVADVEQLFRRIVARWATNGLPLDPEDGELGRLQLEHAVTALRELSVEVASVAQLVRTFERDVHFVDASEQPSETPRPSEGDRIVRPADVQELTQTADALDAAADRIVAFLEDHADSG